MDEIIRLLAIGGDVGLELLHYQYLVFCIEV
jgi:hypothetical protein